LAALHARLRTTTVYVTHDQIEAMTLGERVAVLRDGRIQQVAAPQELYSQPANVFVAAFIGSPAMNLVEADVADGALRFGGHTIPLPTAGAPPAGRVIAGLRPEAFEDGAFADPTLPRLDVQIDVVEELGADTHVLFTVAVPPVEVSDVQAAAGDEHGLVEIDGSLFTARVDPATAARPGVRMELALNPARIHYFDPESGLRLTPASAPATTPESAPALP
ncbi:MAG: ABC transporter ATP-binding protein, partial [Acidobacteriota bacterium]|nr:ABC transporter ATP-binding protein [Acidobacteriota bacterium]